MSLASEGFWIRSDFDDDEAPEDGRRVMIIMLIASRRGSESRRECSNGNRMQVKWCEGKAVSGVWRTIASEVASVMFEDVGYNLAINPG